MEDLVAVIQRLPKKDPLPDTVFKALHHLDSRALALLLKVREGAGHAQVHVVRRVATSGKGDVVLTQFPPSGVAQSFPCRTPSFA